MLSIINKKSLMGGAKVAGVVGVGAVAAKVGGYALMRASTTIAEFATKSDRNAAIVEAVGGAAVAAAGTAAAVALKVVRPATALRAGPFMLGGIVLVTALPRLIDMISEKVAAAVDKVVGMVKPGGSFFDMPRLMRNRVGALLAPVGGLIAREADGIALGGELARAGGLYPDTGRGPRVGGELRRPGGMYAGRGLGGELARY